MTDHTSIELTDKQLIDVLKTELADARRMESLGQITGSLAHEINNLLGITMGYSSMVLDRYADDIPDKMKGYLEKSLESSQRTKELVMKMSEFSYFEEQEPVQINLNVVLNDIVFSLKLFSSDEVQLEFEVDDSTVPIYFVPYKLKLMLRILYENAVESMSGKGIVKIKARNVFNIDAVCDDCQQNISGDWVELSMTDVGTGIKDEHREHFFEGKGMGLAMLHSILSRNNGHCIVDTESDTGSDTTINTGTSVRLLLPTSL